MVITFNSGCENQWQHAALANVSLLVADVTELEQVGRACDDTRQVICHNDITIGSKPCQRILKKVL